MLDNIGLRFSMDMIKKKKKNTLKLLVSAVLVLCWGFFSLLNFCLGFALLLLLCFFLSMCSMSCFICVVFFFCLSICHPPPRAAVGCMCLSYPLHWWGKSEEGGRDGPCFVSLLLLAMLSLLSLGKFCTNSSYLKHKCFGEGYIRAGDKYSMLV